MKIYVVVGYNGILRCYGAVGAATTREGAERIAEEKAWKLDAYQIDELELEEASAEARV